jgi:hypothetical protein
VEFESDDDQELERLLVAHLSQLAEALNTAPARIEALRSMTAMNRIVRVRVLVKAAKERQHAVNAAAMQNLSIASAAMLGKLAQWGDERVQLDHRIVLGRSLVSDRACRYICFAAEGYDPIAIRREKLVDAAKALKFADLSCRIDQRGLRFSWGGDRGGLLLVSQRIEAQHRGAVLSVVIERPRPRAELSVSPPRERASSWMGDVFNELSIF